MAARREQPGQRPRRGSCRSPDILVAMDVDPVELMLQVLIFHVGHVIDHLQDDKSGKHRQHKPLLGQTNTRVRAKALLPNQ